MKKTILLLLAVIGATQSLSAQHTNIERKAWFDIQVVQHIGLNNWSDVSYANDGLPKAAITEFRGVANLFIARQAAGIFLDMGVGIMPAPSMRSFDLDRMPMPNNGTKYHLREMLSESGTGKASAHFKISGGVFGNIRATDKLNIMPYFGVGGMTVTHRSYEMILKEEGTNMQYRTLYVWGLRSNDEYFDYPDSDMLGYLTGRLNFKYRINPRMNFTFGLEYTYFFDTANFYGRFTNTFNGNVRRTIMIEGNNMNMLGISAGISFM